MNTYESQLTSEVLSVGALVVVVDNVLQKTLPRASPTFRLFLTGALIHIGCEFSGLNEWYIKHGAITIWNHPDKIYERELEKKWVKSSQQSSSSAGSDSTSMDGFDVSR
jgi:hypothetical protein